jgi:hypothetical protein
MAMQNPTPKVSKEAQAVIDALGTSGEKVVAFVNKTVSDQINANAEELRKAAERYNEYVRTSEAKERGNTELLTSIRDAINIAIGAHSPIAMALNTGQQVTPAAVAEAVQATAAVNELETTWKTTVDDTLEDHRRRIVALEGLNKVPTLAPVPTPVPEAAKGDIEVLEERLNDSRVSQIKFINPRRWGGLAWALAVVGLFIGSVIMLNVWEGFFPAVPGALQLVRWLTLLLIPMIGFFSGGAIGSFFESRHQATAVVAAT